MAPRSSVTFIWTLTCRRCCSSTFKDHRDTGVNFGTFLIFNNNNLNKTRDRRTIYGRAALPRSARVPSIPDTRRRPAVRNCRVAVKNLLPTSDDGVVYAAVNLSSPEKERDAARSDDQRIDDSTVAVDHDVGASEGSRTNKWVQHMHYGSNKPTNA